MGYVGGKVRGGGTLDIWSTVVGSAARVVWETWFDNGLL